MHTHHAVHEVGACTRNRSFDPGPCYCQPSMEDGQAVLRFKVCVCVCVCLYVCMCVYLCAWCACAYIGQPEKP